MSHAQANESPAPAHDAVDRGDHGLLERTDRQDVRVVRRAQTVADVRRLPELGQILAGAEAPSGARDDDRAHLRVACLLQRRAQPVVHRAVERVQHVGAVQRDRLHRAVSGDLHLGHRAHPTTGACPQAVDPGARHGAWHRG